MVQQDQNALDALARSSLVSMILLDQSGQIRFMNEPAKYALPFLKTGQDIKQFVQESHHGRLADCLNVPNDFTLKLLQLRFKSLKEAMLWEVFRIKDSGEVVMVTQETGFAVHHREMLIRQQEAVFQALEDGFFEVNDHGQLLSVNQTLQNWLNKIDKKQLSLDLLFDHGSQNHDFFHKLEFVRSKSVPAEGVCLLTKSNKWCRFELLPRPGIVMVRLTDISEEVLADEALKLAQNRLLAILESTEDANVLIDKSGKLLSINRKAKLVLSQWLGFYPEEETDLMVQLKANSKIEFEPLFLKACQGEFVSLELKIENIEGQEQWFNIRMFPAKNEEQEIFAISFNLSDITKHKQAEHQLIENERKLLAFFNSSPEAQILFDQNGKVKFFNKKLLELPIYLRNKVEVKVGYSLEALGLKFPTNELERILNATLSGESIQQIFQVHNFFNEANWWEINTYPSLANDGSLLGAVWLLEDVTEIYLAKHEIFNRNKELRELAQIHSHEVRRPLANVLALLDMIAGDQLADKNQDDVLKEHLSNQIAELDFIIKQLGKRNYL